MPPTQNLRDIVTINQLTAFGLDEAGGNMIGLLRVAGASNLRFANDPHNPPGRVVLNGMVICDIT